MLNYVQGSDTIHHVLANTVKGGDLVEIGNIVAIAVSDGDGSSLCACKTSGVFRLPKDEVEITVGSNVYWDSAEKECTTDGEGNRLIGLAWKTAEAEDDFVEVSLVQLAGISDVVEEDGGEQA